VEFCTNHRQIEDEGYRARILPAHPTTFNLWEREPEYLVRKPEPGHPAGDDDDWNPLHDG
jgi:hypothetical protein